MHDRQKFILTSVVNEYVKTAQPVGSSTLVDRYHLDVSPATIRNDMKVLEDEGFLTQPHLSAGRVPTDAGYRAYVNSLLEQRKRDLRMQKRMYASMESLIGQRDTYAHALIRLLSEFSHDVAVDASPEGLSQVSHSGFSYLLRKPEFRDNSRASDVAELLENDQRLYDMLSSLHEKSVEEDERSVSISIGSEHDVKALEHCSILLCQYVDHDGARHMVALLGPTRMRYDQNVALLEVVSRFLKTNSLAAMVVLAPFGSLIIFSS
jgi:heat-inducible transcriptional repressor